MKSIPGWLNDMNGPGLKRSRSLTVALCALLLGSFGWLELSVAPASPLENAPEDPPVSLAELKDSQSMALLIKRSSVVNYSESDDPTIAEALSADPRESLKHRSAYRVIATKLNRYMRKYRSMSAVQEVAEADFIVYFKLVEYRRLFNGVYPYGELFIIVNPRDEGSRPARIVWKTKKVTFAEDAIKDFVRELRRVRQEH